MRRTEFKRPVLGRLIWGWVAFGALIAASIFFLILAQVQKPKIGRLSLNIDEEVERLTPAPAALHLNVPENAVNVTRSVPARGATPATTASADSNAASENAPSLRYAEADHTGGPKTYSIARSASPSTPVNEPAPINNPINDIDDAPPGELKITIDGRDIDDYNASVQRARDSKGAASFRVNTPSTDLTKPSAYGSIPAISSDGRRSAQYYAAQSNTRNFRKPGTDHQVVSNIMTGLGLNEDLTEQAIIELPSQVSLAFAPYGKNLDHWASLAREYGHEILLEVPMEAYGNTNNIGPAGLSTAHDPAANLKRMDWILSRMQGYFGVTNYQGAKFSANQAAMQPIMVRLSSLGIAYIDDTGAAPKLPRDNAGDVARLLTGIDTTSLRASFQGLSARAEATNFALGKIVATQKNIEEILHYSESLEETELTLVPASTVLYVGNQY